MRSRSQVIDYITYLLINSCPTIAGVRTTSKVREARGDCCHRASRTVLAESSGTRNDARRAAEGLIGIIVEPVVELNGYRVGSSIPDQVER